MDFGRIVEEMRERIEKEYQNGKRGVANANFIDTDCENRDTNWSSAIEELKHLHENRLSKLNGLMSLEKRPREIQERFFAQKGCIDSGMLSVFGVTSEDKKIRSILDTASFLNKFGSCAVNMNNFQLYMVAKKISEVCGTNYDDNRGEAEKILALYSSSFASNSEDVKNHNQHEEGKLK